MFGKAKWDEAKWHELLSKLLSQPSKGNAREIRTRATNKLNYFKIKNNRIYVATSKTSYEKCNEVPGYMFKKVYNKLLERGLPLSQKQISKDRDLYVKRSSFVITALSLLPEIEYDRPSNSLKYTG